MELKAIAIAHRDFVQSRYTLLQLGNRGDPPWSILFELFINDDKRRFLSIGDISILTCIPHTTCMRWIGALVEQGLVTKRGDPHDKRRTYVILTPQGSQVAEQALEMIGRGLGSLRYGGANVMGSPKRAKASGSG